MWTSAKGSKENVCVFCYDFLEVVLTFRSQAILHRVAGYLRITDIYIFVLVGTERVQDGLVPILAVVVTNLLVLENRSMRLVNGRNSSNGFPVRDIITKCHISTVCSLVW